MSRQTPTGQVQLSLGGLEAPRATDRLFFAVKPDASAAQAIHAMALRLRDRRRLKGALRPIDHLHVTLHHLGDWAGLPPSLLADAHAVGAAVAHPIFEAGFDRAESFLGRQGNRPFVLRTGESESPLQQLQQAVGRQMTERGLAKYVDAHFVPHITLLYDDQIVTEQPIEAIRWTVCELVLVHSLLGRTQHQIVGRWPLLPA